MLIALILLTIAGIAALIGLPVRLALAGRWLSGFRRLRLAARLVSGLGLVLLAPATVLWLYSLHVLYKVFVNPGTPPVWGRSELSMILSALGAVFLAAELLLLPLSLSTPRSLLARSSRPQ